MSYQLKQLIGVVICLFIFPGGLWGGTEAITGVGAANGNEEYVAGEILVKFKQELSEEEINETIVSLGGIIIDYMQEIGVYLLKVPNELTVPELANRYSKDSRCEYAEPNYLGKGGDFIRNDTFFHEQWHLHNTGQSGGTADADIDAVEGWQITRGSSLITVAVLDTGIDSDHPEFEGRISAGFDFVNNDDNPEADHPHGTSVSGIIAANASNNFSVTGVDHNVRILPVKVLNSQSRGSVSDLVKGLVFSASQGAHVINMSLIDYPLTSSLINALQFARNAGAILIACAGNGGIGNADISAPGRSPLTISVGATDRNDMRASFSGTGKALDVVAPGVNIPTVFSGSNEDRAADFGACSAATPIVSGIATLLLSIDPTLTHEAIREILLMSAEDLVGPFSEDAPGRDDFFGYGRVNMQNALLLVSKPPEKLNDKFAPLGPADVTTAFSWTPCGGASVGTFTITATFGNISSDTLSNLVIAVNTLTGGNVLCNADGGPGGAGAIYTVLLQGDLADGQLSPGESFVVELPVGLQSFNPFTFPVDVLGKEAL